MNDLNSSDLIGQLQVSQHSRNLKRDSKRRDERCVCVCVGGGGGGGGGEDSKNIQDPLYLEFPRVLSSN